MWSRFHAHAHQYEYDSRSILARVNSSSWTSHLMKQNSVRLMLIVHFEVFMKFLKHLNQKSYYLN